MAEEIEAAFASIDLSDIESLVVDNLNVMNYANFQCNMNVNGNISMSQHDLTASGISAQSFRYKDQLMTLQTVDIPSRTNIFSGITGFNVMLGDGTQKIIYGWQNVPSIGSKTIQYLGVSTSED